MKKYLTILMMGCTLLLNITPSALAVQPDTNTIFFQTILAGQSGTYQPAESPFSQGHYMANYFISGSNNPAKGQSITVSFDPAFSPGDTREFTDATHVKKFHFI